MTKRHKKWGREIKISTESHWPPCLHAQEEFLLKKMSEFKLNLAGKTALNFLKSSGDWSKRFLQREGLHNKNVQIITWKANLLFCIIKEHPNAIVLEKTSKFLDVNMFIQSIIKIKFIKNKHERKQNKKKGANQNKSKIPPLTTKKKKNPRKLKK